MEGSKIASLKAFEESLDYMINIYKESARLLSMEQKTNTAKTDQIPNISEQNILKLKNEWNDGKKAFTDTTDYCWSRKFRARLWGEWVFFPNLYKQSFEECVYLK